MLEYENFDKMFSSVNASVQFYLSSGANFTGPNYLIKIPERPL